MPGHKPDESLVKRNQVIFWRGYFMYHPKSTENQRRQALRPEEEIQRRDGRTPRISFRRYSESSLKYLFNSGNNQALLNCCGVDHRVFRQLLELFSPVFNAYTFNDATG